jgi:hypothetical protein
MAIAAEAIFADIQSVTAPDWSSELPLIANDESTVRSEASAMLAKLSVRAAT